MKKNILLIPVACALAIVGVSQVNAVELLVSGDFETPGAGVGDIPGWTLEQFVTGSDEEITTATLTGGTDIQLWLLAFAGGSPLGPSQGNFNNDGLPAGNVDGRDFLIWQRNFGRTDALPADGDATNDMVVNSDDLSIWQSNYGKSPAGVFTNAVLSQVVPAAAGETYSFQGTSTFEDNYSGFVTTLDAESPHGAIPSPTVTQFKMEFLNSSGNVIGAPTTFDLRTEQTFPGFPIVHTPLTAVAPAGTTNVRVVAEALNMAWNGNSATMGGAQSAFFNDFTLTDATNPGMDRLTNGNLDIGIPDALDFWNVVTNPDPSVNPEILRTPIAPWANNTPGGTRGVWLSAFFGAHPNFEPDPVDGIISQTVEAQAGATYTFSGWTRFEAGYSGGVDTINAASTGFFAGMTSPTRTEIELAFLDINGDVISSSVIDAKEARRLLSPTMNANDGVWREHELEAVAPAGTVFARLSAQMIEGVFNIDPGQSAFFDDFSLIGPNGVLIAGFAAVPEPASLLGLVLGTLIMGLKRNRK